MSRVRSPSPAPINQHNQKDLSHCLNFDTVTWSTVDQHYGCTEHCMGRLQQGSVTKKSGKWLGHYSVWTRDQAGKRRIQKACILGEIDRMTLTNARRLLRRKLEEELGLRASHRIEVGWFIEQRWKPLRAGTWKRRNQTDERTSPRTDQASIR